MKKKCVSLLCGLVVVAVVLAVIAGCSTVTGIDISPPSWALGTWTAWNGTVTFKFLSDNIIYTNRNGITISFVKQYAGMQVTEQQSDTSYTVTIIDLDTTIVYSFTLSADTITYQVINNGGTIDIGNLTEETS